MRSAILLDEKIDPALAAEILTLPSANEIAELFAIIDPIAIAAVREALTRTLAKELADEFRGLQRQQAGELAWNTPISASVHCAIPACAIWRLVKLRWRISWSSPSIIRPTT
jgi:hypothetical protein